MVKGVIWEANAFEFRWQDSPHVRQKGRLYRFGQHHEFLS